MNLGGGIKFSWSFLSVHSRNSPGIKAFVSPYYSSATKPTNTNFTRNVQTRSTVHGGSVRDRVTPLHSKTSAAAYPEESQDTSALGGRSSRMSFFNKLTSKFSKRSVTNLVLSFIHSFIHSGDLYSTS